MSGNPFRASLASKHPTAAPAASFINVDSSRAAEARDERESDAVLDALPAQPAKTKKSVRIESPTETIPPHSAFPDVQDPLLHRANRGHHAGSPPPMSPAGFSDNFEDIDADDGRRTEDSHAEGMTGSVRKSTGAPELVHSPGGAPINPFSRTLASIEPQEKGIGESAGQSIDRTSTEKTTPGNTKPSLDVEGFKNLLMTGISSPRSSGPPPQAVTAPNPISASVFESSSSTDTSSVSRQSIFDPAVQEPHPESPRTSYDMAASDDERVSLMGEVKKEKKKPPPAPKHRHGKLVSSRTPQTVAFDAFSATEATSSPPTSRNRTHSDLNKPLPPTPPVVSPSAHIISQDSTQDSLSISDARTSDTASLSDVSPAQKKVPPPVPLARRQSQLRSSTVGSRSRSNSSLTMSSQQSSDLPLLSPGPNQEPTSSPSQKAPPPPPPTRRHGAALSTISTSSANSSSTELTSTATTIARRPTVSSPNPPSSRRTTFSSEPPSPSPGLQRTSSINSNRNVNVNANASRSVSNESSASMPPPPPPPRRRQSGRTSLDKERPSMNHPPSSPTESRRTSKEYKRNSIDSKRRTSVASESSLKYEYAPAAESEHVLYSPREEKEENMEEMDKVQTNASNILDDMERFQKEIDELRERYKQAA